MDYFNVPTRDGSSINVVVETPRGSRAKFKLKPGTGTFMMSRPLALGLHYPFDWGFVPSTVAEDGDPLDALVIHDAVSYPGTIIRCNPVAILDLRQTERGATRRNDRIILVPSTSRRQERWMACGRSRHRCAKSSRDSSWHRPSAPRSAWNFSAGATRKTRYPPSIPPRANIISCDSCR